jgi:homoserine/homoserine lactone efflux protein
MHSTLPIQLWLGFAATQLAFALTPGPAVLLVSSQAMSRGTGAGIAAAAGVQTGNGIYLALSALGLGAVLETSEQAFTFVKYAGAAYLVFLGLRTLWRARHIPAEGFADSHVPLWERSYIQGTIKQLANPKSVLFFGALLPQFVGPDHANFATFVLLGLTCVIIELPILAGYAWIAGRGGVLFQSKTQLVWRERLSGCALVAVGAAIARMGRAS